MAFIDIARKKRDNNEWSEYTGGEGKGIVMCGGGIYAPSAYVAVRHLRTIGCTLPIEIWAFDTTETTPDWIALMKGLGNLEIKYSVLYADGYGIARGYESKIIALNNSSFQHVMLMDADNIALKDPIFLFDTPEYQEHGQIFWPDQLFANDEMWAIRRRSFDDFQIPYQIGLEIESGQLVVDRKRCWKELDMTGLMNQHSLETYKLYSWGDKDTFVLSWMFLGSKYYVIPKRPHVTLAQEGVILQFGIDGEPLFQHQRKFFFAPHMMHEKIKPYEHFKKEMIRYINDYYGVIPFTGDLRMPIFSPQR